MTGDLLHRKERTQVMQQVDKVAIPVAEVRIAFTLVAWIATLVIPYSSGMKRICRNSLTPGIGYGSYRIFSI